FDDRDNVTPGWKFNEWLKGVPVRVEIGPRDLAEGKVMSVRRDTFEKAPLDIEGLEGEIKAMLDAIQTNMFEIARAFRDAHTADVHNMEELGRQVDGGYAKAMWCGDQACEDGIRIVSARLPLHAVDQTPIGETCVCCGKPARRSSISQRHIDVEGAVQTYSPF
ncbi:MAG: His/Gly/Thr/Pro-type tRNA ligase C-terminal domain-containing protein, partial [Christensenellales bacterium]